MNKHLLNNQMALKISLIWSYKWPFMENERSISILIVLATGRLKSNNYSYKHHNRTIIVNNTE